MGVRLQSDYSPVLVPKQTCFCSSQVVNQTIEKIHCCRLQILIDRDSRREKTVHCRHIAVGAYCEMIQLKLWVRQILKRMGPKTKPRGEVKMKEEVEPKVTINDLLKR